MRTVNNEKRIFEFWAGRQLIAGKTTALRARARWLASKASVRAVWWLGLGMKVETEKFELPPESVRVYESFADYLNDGEFRRIVVWQLGEDPSEYTAVIQEASELGDIALIIDECYEFAPAGAVWTGSHALKRVVLAGRHLPRRVDGEDRPTHLLIAAQYPRTVHHLVWSQAATVMCGVLSGENSFDWVRSNFGRTALAQVQALKPHEWLMLFGEKRPALPGYGPNG